MSTGLLYHAWGIRGYDYLSTKYIEGHLEFTICHQLKELRCCICRSPDVICRGTTPRRFRGIPVGLKKVFFELEVQRLECRQCAEIRQAHLGFAEPHVSYTKGFERYALDLLQEMTIDAVAKHLGISWDVIKDIQKRNLEKRFSKPNLKTLLWIAIDEISVLKGNRYVTVVMDLNTGAVIFVGDGKGADALIPFWKRLKRAKAHIEAVATDMSAAYLSAIRENLPDATHVLDHFHVVKLFQEKLSDLRRDLFHQATDAQKAVLKGSRWLLLKNPENLRALHNEQARLEEALALNRPLAIAYYLKEDLRTFWSQKNKEAANIEISSWIAKAESSGIEMLESFAKTLSTHRDGILAYYDCPISTGRLEGMNNKIKTMKRQAYGYRDMAFFKLKILAIHEAKHALVG
jgi:transposase